MVKPLGLIHMTHGDIKRLEGALKVTLPQCYTELLLRYPAAFEENGFHFGDGFEPLSKRFFVKDIDRLIELNETAGAAGERLADEAPWPAHLFAIGENAGGDYYLLDLGSVIGRVLFFNRAVDRRLCLPAEHLRQTEFAQGIVTGTAIVPVPVTGA